MFKKDFMCQCVALNFLSGKWEYEEGYWGAWVSVSERWVEKENIGLFCSSMAWNNSNKIEDSQKLSFKYEHIFLCLLSV